MTQLSKNEQISVRTTSRTKDKVEQLAERIDDHKYEFPYDSSIKRCASVSGLVHEILSGNITFAKIEQHLKIVEEN